MCLLVVEDDHDVRSAIVRISEGYFKEVWWAEKPHEALLLIEKHKPKVIVTDWDLNDQLTGIDVATYAVENVVDGRVILITGNSISQLKSQTRHLPINCYVAKPFSVAELRHTFAALI